MEITPAEATAMDDSYGLGSADERARRYMRSVATLRRYVEKGTITLGSRDRSGNSVQTVINALESAINRCLSEG